MEEFFLEKPVFFRAKNKTVIRRGPNPNVCLLVWGNATRDNFSGPSDNFSGPRGTVLPPVFAIHNQADVFEHEDNQLPKYEDLFPSTQININTEMK